MTDDPAPDRTRRALLRRLGLASAMAYVAPALTQVGIARASASGGGDDDDDGAGGGGVPGGGDRDPAPARRRPPQQAPRPAPAQPARRRASAPPPELVALVPAGVPREALLAQGYAVLAERAGIAGRDLLRLALPPGVGPEQAVADLPLLLPGATADVNHLYTPDDLLCRDGDCDAQAMVGWSGWPSALAPRIGMIDTGINTDHAALDGQRLTVVQAELAGRDIAGRQHGTAVAALLIGRLESPTPGLLPYAELIAVEAFHAGEDGAAADAFALSDALQRLIAARVSVANLSFSGPENAVLAAVVAEAVQSGIALVAAAGNGGPGAPPAYPAAWPGVVAVTALDGRKRPYRQAARGAHIAFAAPGVNLWTAASISGGRLRSGTSYAAPFVTAALAVERLRTPSATVAEVVDRLAACAGDLGDAGRDAVFGHGLITAGAQCRPGEGVGPDDFLLSGE